MRDRESWMPSKFVRRRGRLMASRDIRQVSCCSRLMVDLVAAWYDEVLPRYARGHLLDLGCGNVPLYDAYRDHCDQVTCVDWGSSPHACRHLDQTADLTGVLPLAGSTYDTVLLSDVLEHIPTPESTCAEIARVLKPGGTLIMNVPFFYWLHEQPYDFYRYTEYALSRLMRTSSLHVVQLDQLGGAADIMADVFAKLITHLPLLGTPLAIGAQGFMELFGRTRFGTKVRERTSSTLPFAYGMVAIKAPTQHTNNSVGS